MSPRTFGKTTNPKTTIRDTRERAMQCMACHRDIPDGVAHNYDADSGTAVHAPQCPPGEKFAPFTVVKDWDSSQDDREAVAFPVWAANASDALDVAEDVAQRMYGDDAEYLYGVMIFKGHPEAVRA